MSVLTLPLTPVDLVLRLAKSYRWVREVGQNDGEAVRHILRVASLGPKNPWCMAFVSMVGRDAFGDDWPLPLLGSCEVIAERARAKGLLFPYPAPGAVFLLWSERLSRFHHAGFVDHPTARGWATVEGNSNDDGSAEGIGVFVRDGEDSRDFGGADRFIYWWAPTREAA